MTLPSRFCLCYVSLVICAILCLILTAWITTCTRTRIGDDVLDPGKESLHSRVNARIGSIGATPPQGTAHHSEQDKLAWQRDSVDGVFAVVENIFRTKS